MPLGLGTSLGGNVGQSHYTRINQIARVAKSQVSKEPSKSVNSPQAMHVSRNFG